MQKTKMWLERKSTTKQRRRRGLLRGNTSTNNPGGGSNLTKANGLEKTKNRCMQITVQAEEMKVLGAVIQ